MATGHIGFGRVRIALAIVAGLLLLAGCAPSAIPSTPAPLAPQVPVSPVVAPVQELTPLQKLVEAARREGVVTLYAYDFVSDAGMAMQRAFTDRYGIKVEIITGRGAEFIERLKTEARSGKRVGDLTEGAATHVTNMKVAGLTVALNELPVLQEKNVWKVDPAFFGADGHLLAVYPYFMQPLINTKLIKPEEEPKSWFDLLQPKWKGKILFNDPVVSVGGYQTFQPLIKGGALNEDYLKKLGDQDIIFVTGAFQGVEWLARGQASIHAGTNAATASNVVLEGAPIKVIDFKEGMAGQLNVQAVIKDSPHPNAAKLFANWYLSKEGQTVFARTKGAPSVRNDVPSGLPPALGVEPVKPVFATFEDIGVQGDMFANKVWVPFLKKGK